MSVSERYPLLSRSLHVTTCRCHVGGCPPVWLPCWTGTGGCWCDLTGLVALKSLSHCVSVPPSAGLLANQSAAIFVTRLFIDGGTQGPGDLRAVGDEKCSTSCAAVPLTVG
jgi:hypothetical protein